MKNEGTVVEHVMPMGRLLKAGPRYEKSRKATRRRWSRAKAKAKRIMQKLSRRRNRR